MRHPDNRPRQPNIDHSGTQFVSKGNRWLGWFDVYHELLRRPWRFTVTVLFSSWVASNAIFAALYQLGGDCISAPDPHSFFQAFTFSVQTISSIGYGAMHPTTDWARALANLEAFVGMLMMAVATGLMFAKFSRPTARIDFSHNVLVQHRDGTPHLVLRMTNQRGNRIVGARMHLAMLIDEETTEGQKMRRIIDLPLVREHTPTFAMSLILMHRLDESSPLAGMTEAQMKAVIAMMIVTVQGLDETFSQTVHAQNYYKADHIVWAHRFIDMVHVQPNGTIEIDHSLLDAIEPIPAPDTPA